MQVHFGIELLRAEWKKAIACIGTFDGVHLGHQQVIRQAVRQASDANMPCVLLTFDRHPAAVLAPERCPKAISPLQENLFRFSELGVSVAVILQFDAGMSRLSAQRFLDDYLIGAVKASHLVVGHDFAMGNNREGNTDWLRGHIPTTVIEPFEIEGSRVSSSEIRHAIEVGDMPRATQLLGRPFGIQGIVVEGERLGRQLGYPTANMARSFDQAMPSDGVYAGWFDCEFGRFMAAASIGTRPAVGGKHRTIEPYLLDYPGHSLYGKSVTLGLCKKLRDEMYFDSLDELKRQIAMDVDEVRLLLESKAALDR